MKFSAYSKARRFSSGQAVLLVLLGMAVVLTIVISIASRSVTDVSITTTEEESSKAFSAAEAGIENFLSGGALSGSLSETNASYTVQPSEVGSGSNVDFASMGSYRNGEVATLWFVSHNDNDTTKLTCTDKPCFNGDSFILCWGSNPSDIPAVEVNIYYGNRSNVFSGNLSSVKVKRYAFDPSAGRSTGFDSVASGCSGIPDSVYNYSASLSGLPSGLLFARIRFIYNNTPQAFAVIAPSGNSFPAQGRLISSLGTAGQSSRRVEVVDLYRAPLSVFEAGLVSGGHISK